MAMVFCEADMWGRDSLKRYIVTSRIRLTITNLDSRFAILCKSRKSEARVRSHAWLRRVPSDRDRDSHPFRLQMDREQAGSRIREQCRVRQLAVTHPFVRMELCAEPHSKFSSLDNA